MSLASMSRSSESVLSRVARQERTSPARSEGFAAFAGRRHGRLGFASNRLELGAEGKKPFGHPGPAEPSVGARRVRAGPGHFLGAAERRFDLGSAIGSGQELLEAT